MRLAFRLCILIFLFASSGLTAQIITTLAGDGISGSSGDGGPATNAHLTTPSGVACDRKGNIFFSDQNASAIRKVDRFGIITTIAGTGVTGYSGDGGPATAAMIFWPTGLAVDGIGNVFIADQFNNVIRKVDTFGIISTLAGIGSIGYSGDGGPATACSFWHPNDIAADTAGNVFVADRDNNVIRKITATGLIYSIGGMNTPGFSGDGGPATNAQLNFPSGICLDVMGNIYVADLYNNRIRKIDTSGIITTLAGAGLTGFSPDGTPASAARIDRVAALAADSLGNIFFTDYYNNLVRKVDTAGILTTIAGNRVNSYSGDGGPATLASISIVEGVAVDTSGCIYIADFYNARVRKIAPAPSPLRYRCTHQENYNVYPVPATDWLYIANAPASATASLFTILGRQVAQASRTAGVLSVNTSTLPPGTYILRVTDGDSVNSYMVEKQ